MWKAEQKSMAVFLIDQFININAFENCRKKTPFAEEDDEEEEAPVEEETLRAFALNLCRNATSTTFSIIASQPFYVIAVRTMAQFVGQEQKYTWVTLNHQLDFLIFNIIYVLVEFLHPPKKFTRKVESLDFFKVSHRELLEKY